MDLRQMNPAQIRAVAYGLTVVLNLTENYAVAVDKNGASFAVYTLPEKDPLPRSWWQKLLLVPECNGLCGFNLKRRHLTCGVCRFRLLKEGKLQPIVPVTVYFLAMGQNRRFEKLQGWLGKKLLALVEYIELKGEQRRQRT
jgi:hypothetical protein